MYSFLWDKTWIAIQNTDTLERQGKKEKEKELTCTQGVRKKDSIFYLTVTPYDSFRLIKLKPFLIIENYRSFSKPFETNMNTYIYI